MPLISTSASRHDDPVLEVPGALGLGVGGERDLGMVAMVLGHDAGAPKHRGEPTHNGSTTLEHRLAVPVGGGGVLGEQRTERLELLEVEGAEVGVLEPLDGLERGWGVHLRISFLDTFPSGRLGSGGTVSARVPGAGELATGVGAGQACR